MRNGTITRLIKQSKIIVGTADNPDRQFKMTTDAKSLAMNVVHDLLKDEKLEPEDEIIVNVRILIYKPSFIPPPGEGL